MPKDVRKPKAPKAPKGGEVRADAEEAAAVEENWTLPPKGKKKKRSPARAGPIWTNWSAFSSS